MSGKQLIEKYDDPSNAIVTIYINNIPIETTLIDLRAAINILTTMTMEKLELENLRPTPTILEIVDKSKVHPSSIVDDVIVTLGSWEYPMYFLVIQPKSMGGHMLILGRPWLAIVDAFISCR